MAKHLSLRSAVRCLIWLWLLSGCTATQRQEAKTVVCHVCEQVQEYCATGMPLTEAQKQGIIHELYPDAGVPDAAH